MYPLFHNDYCVISIVIIINIAIHILHFFFKFNSYLFNNLLILFLKKVCKISAGGRGPPSIYNYELRRHGLHVFLNPDTVLYSVWYEKVRGNELWCNADIVSWHSAE